MENKKTILIRFPSETANLIEELRKHTHRSFSAEVVFIVEEYFRLTSQDSKPKNSDN